MDGEQLRPQLTHLGDFVSRDPIDCRRQQSQNFLFIWSAFRVWFVWNEIHQVGESWLLHVSEASKYPWNLHATTKSAKSQIRPELLKDESSEAAWAKFDKFLGCPRQSRYLLSRLIDQNLFVFSLWVCWLCLITMMSFFSLLDGAWPESVGWAPRSLARTHYVNNPTHMNLAKMHCLHFCPMEKIPPVPTLFCARGFSIAVTQVGVVSFEVGSFFGNRLLSSALCFTGNFKDASGAPTIEHKHIQTSPTYIHPFIGLGTFSAFYWFLLNVCQFSVTGSSKCLENGFPQCTRPSGWVFLGSGNVFSFWPRACFMISIRPCRPIFLLLTCTSIKNKINSFETRQGIQSREFCIRGFSLNKPTKIGYLVR